MGNCDESASLREKLLEANDLEQRKLDLISVHLTSHWLAYELLIQTCFDQYDERKQRLLEASTSNMLQTRFNQYMEQLDTHVSEQQTEKQDLYQEETILLIKSLNPQLNKSIEETEKPEKVEEETKEAIVIVAKAQKSEEAPETSTEPEEDVSSDSPKTVVEPKVKKEAEAAETPESCLSPAAYSPASTVIISPPGTTTAQERVAEVENSPQKPLLALSQPTPDVKLEADLERSLETNEEDTDDTLGHPRIKEETEILGEASGCLNPT